MTEVAKQRATRLRLQPQATVVLCGLVAFTLQAIAGWPGWMTPDGVAIWQMAMSGSVSDQYPPMLTWAWSVLRPEAHGPLLPFLLQLQVFWVGVALAAWSLQPGPRWTRYLPLLMLINPATWTMLVVRPESALTAMIALTIGVAALALRSYRRSNRSGALAAILAAAVVAGFAAATNRLFLPLAILLIAALAMAVLPRQLGRRRRTDMALKAVVLTVTSTVLVTISLPAVVIGTVESSRVAESSFALDAFHVDCASVWSQGQRSTSPVSPEGLWRTPVAPCESGRPGTYADMWTGSDDPAGEQVLGFGEWLGIAASNPSAVLGGRLQHVTDLLTSPVVALPSVSGAELTAAAGAGGLGETVDHPNRGGLLTGAASAAIAVVPATALLWIVGLPLLAGLWVRRQGREQRRSVLLWPLLAFPAVLSAALALLAPTSQSTAMAPGAALGALIAMWAVGSLSLRIPSFEVWQQPAAAVRHDYLTGPTQPPARRRRRRQPQGQQAAGSQPERRQTPEPVAGRGRGSLSDFVAEIDLREEREPAADQPDR